VKEQGMQLICPVIDVKERERLKMNWTEKYRPNKIDEIVGQPKFVDDARGWLEKNDMPNVLMYGPAGTGKTSAAIVLGKEFLGKHYETHFKEINASQDRRLDTIRDTITNFASWKHNDEVPFKICLLDEIDGMTKDSQRALKRTMERAHNVRFIITCNNEHNVEYPIRSRCANYWFKSLEPKVMRELCIEICEKENVVYSSAAIYGFCNALNGDLRRAINEIQATAHSKSSLEEKTKEFMNDYEEILKKLNNEELSDAHGMLLAEVYLGRSIQEIAHNLHHCVLEMEMKGAEKFNNLARIGEMEWRSKSMTPKVLVSWFIAQYW
jgi:replication factor C small subunit